MKVFLILFLVSFGCFAGEEVIEVVEKVSDQAWYLVVIGGIILVIDYIIGKTKLVKANSTIDLIIQFVLKILKAIVGKK